MAGDSPYPEIPTKDWIVPRDPQAAGPGAKRTCTHYLPWFLTMAVTMSMPWYFWWLTEDA